MKKYLSLVGLSVLSLFCCGCHKMPNVVFSATTLPVVEGVVASVNAVPNDNEWKVNVNVTNTTSEAVMVKVRLVAEPELKADSYLFPGINYNGNDDCGAALASLHNSNKNNDFGLPFPQGWAHEGEPWVFAYDRGSIPSCTISENGEHVFALYASDQDALSYESSCSMELKEDGSFRHVIYWPVNEAPLSYSDKRAFSGRTDNYITLQPGESFSATANAVVGEPQWKGYGFAEVFRAAWRNLKHDVPAQWSVDEVLVLDKSYQIWSRCQDERGYWFEGVLEDMKYGAAHSASGLSVDGFSISHYEQNPVENHWLKDYVTESKILREDQYIKSAGSDIGSTGQSFQMARLAIEYGLLNSTRKDVEWGKKVLRSWIERRRYETGIFKSNQNLGHDNRDASNMGWAISELSRAAKFLKEHNHEGSSEFAQAAKTIVDVVLKGVREDGAIGSVWNGKTGEVVTYDGDGAGFVLMGLARYHALTGDEKVLSVIEKAFDYYYKTDIDKIRCYGGAMDCASIDREGAQPFFTASKYMYEQTKNEKYLEYARKAAWYFASWLYIHNPIYGNRDDLTLLNWKPAGGSIVAVEHPAVDEYGALLIGEYLWLSKVDNEPLWREVAELIWRNGTQGFAYDGRTVCHGMIRPIGAKSETIYPTRWSRYASVGRQRGSVNDHLTAWGGIYRAASFNELSESDKEWLREYVRPNK